MLGAFANQVRAQTGKNITVDAAAELLAAADEILSLL